MQKPLPAEESLKHSSCRRAFMSSCSRPSRTWAASRCMTWDERGRLWVCETFDYPNELQPPGKGPRPHPHLRRHRRRRQGRQVHRLRREAEHPDEPRVLPAAASSCSNGTETLFLKDTDGDDKADVREVLFGRLGHARHARRRRATCSTASTTGSGPCRATTARGSTVGGETASTSARGSSASSRTARSSSSSARPNNNTWGLGISEEGIIFGSTANRNPERVHADPEPLLRSGPRLGAVARARR